MIDNKRGKISLGRTEKRIKFGHTSNLNSMSDSMGLVDGSIRYSVDFNSHQSRPLSQSIQAHPIAHRRNLTAFSHAQTF